MRARAASTSARARDDDGSVGPAWSAAGRAGCLGGGWGMWRRLSESSLGEGSEGAGPGSMSRMRGSELRRVMPPGDGSGLCFPPGDGLARDAEMGEAAAESGEAMERGVPRCPIGDCPIGELVPERHVAYDAAEPAGDGAGLVTRAEK